MNTSKTILASAMALILGGCSTTEVAKITRGVSRVDAESAASLEVAQRGVAAEGSLGLTQPSAITRVEASYLSIKKVIAPPSGNKAVIATLNRVIAVNAKFSSMKEMVGYVTQVTGLPISLSMEIEGMANTATVSASSSTSSAQVSGSLPPPPSGISGMSFGQSMAAQPSITFNGKISGFLDLIAANYGVNWEVSDTAYSAHFYKTKSKTFRLFALPGNTNMTAKVGRTSTVTGGAASSSSSSSGSAEQKTGIEFNDLSVWKGVEDSLKTMLSPIGKLTVTPATGTVTVQDVPVVLQSVESYIKEQNVALSRQVVINVRVLQVELNDSDSYGINWNAIYTALDGAASWALANTIAPGAGAVSLTHRVLKNQWAGSSVMIDALSKQGKVSQVTSASLITLNNQPVPVQVGKQTAYLASSTTTIGTGGAGNTVSLTPGTVTTGFSLSMLPHILDGEKMMLQYSGDISSLTAMYTVSSGNSSIQTPEIDTRNFMQRVLIGSNETLVVTGFEQFNLSGQAQGVGNAENVALGGGVATKKGKTVLVVLIQPALTPPQSQSPGI